MFQIWSRPPRRGLQTPNHKHVASAARRTKTLPAATLLGDRAMGAGVVLAFLAGLASSRHAPLPPPFVPPPPLECIESTGELRFGSGGAASDDAADYSQYQYAPWLPVRMVDSGTTLNFSSSDNRGVTASIFVGRRPAEAGQALGARLVLKGDFVRFKAWTNATRGCLQREICVYRLLGAHGVDWAPRALCANQEHGTFIMSDVGTFVGSGNLPRDYRQQMGRILAEMERLGLRHNDMWKKGILVRGMNHSRAQLVERAGGIGVTWPSKHPLELMVDRVGKLRLVDFGWATVNDSYGCAYPTDTGIPNRATKWFSPGNDSRSLDLLDLLAEPDRQGMEAALVRLQMAASDERLRHRTTRKLELKRRALFPPSSRLFPPPAPPPRPILSLVVHHGRRKAASAAAPAAASVNNGRSSGEGGEAVAAGGGAVAAGGEAVAAGGELHLIILWTPLHESAAAVYADASKQFELLGVRVHPAYPTRAAKVGALNRFYQATRRRMNVDDERGVTPFLILFLRLRPTDRVPCAGGASARGKKSCPPTNAFKNSIRQKYRRGAKMTIHATDSIDETRDNLDALNISYDDAIAGRRPTWDSHSAVLASLNEAGVEYVVARNYECAGLLGSSRCRLDDLDLLASDCAAVTYALDPPTGNAAPTAFPSVQPSSVRIGVDVGGKRAIIEARCPRSGYIDDSWLSSALRDRERHAGGFYIMSAEDHTFALVYHDLVQKRRPVLGIHWLMIRQRLQLQRDSTNGGGDGIVNSSAPLERLRSAAEQKPQPCAACAKSALRQFMAERGYVDTRYDRSA